LNLKLDLSATESAKTDVTTTIKAQIIIAMLAFAMDQSFSVSGHLASSIILTYCSALLFSC